MATKQDRKQSDAQLDPVDRSILRELQTDGRVSNQDLAQRVHLSPSACLRRVKQLEDGVGHYSSWHRSR